uniref:Fibrinogen C-terminal domain-containing protein n=1 Tax=Pinctada fucata TaxID=50426 RepID=A0A194APR4_PINFU
MMNFHFVFVISVLVQSTSTTHTFNRNFNDKIDCIKPQDCSRIKQMFPYSKSGVYQIYPASIGIGVHVYCDMTESCGGWTVIQRRMNETGIFTEIGADYKRGFGTPDRNYWLGNDIIHQITANKIMSC